jgi:hypothetical protein
MKVIRTTEEIATRLAEVEGRLSMINKSMEKELAKPFFKRTPKVCLFLSMEKKTWSEVRDQLKWLIDEQ